MAICQLGPRNWGTEKQSDLYKITQQTSKRQSQAWTEPGVFPACLRAWSESWAASQKVRSIYQIPQPWGLLQRAGQNDTECSDVGKLVSTGQGCVVTTKVMETLLLLPLDHVLLKMQLLPGSVRSHFEPWASSFLSLDLRFSQVKTGTGGTRVQSDHLPLLFISDTLCGADPTLTKPLKGKWNMVGEVDSWEALFLTFT